MKKLILIFIALISVSACFAQDKKSSKSSAIINRPGDHILLQLGSDTWAGIPDSIKNHQTGLSRVANVYVMMDKPFKNNRRFSAAFGLGISSSNKYFKNYKIDITSTNSKLPFTNLDSLNRFKKYKLTTAFLEVPVELRFINNPDKEKKSFKAAIGVKVGTLLSVHTKGKTLQNKNGGTINNYVQKDNNKRFFNTTRLSVTGRVGYGNFSLFGSYQINNLLKDGIGPDIKPLQIGICLSGL
jgi:hypothetical protein